MLCLGWGAAHAYTIARAKDDRFQSWEVNYHYVPVNADHQQLTVFREDRHSQIGTCPGNESLDPAYRDPAFNFS